jgi:transcriptional regulator with XRE-family HTH domain
MLIFDGLGRALRWLRERQLKRQYQVAAGAGITKAMLSAYETGKQKPSLDTLEKILDALVCDLNDLHNALQIVNGRPPHLRDAASRGYWRPPGEAGVEAAGADLNLYEILGFDEPLPPQEERALSEMLSGFHKLLRYMHDRAAQSGAPPSGAAAPGGSAPPESDHP